MNGELNAIVSRIRDLINQPRCQQSLMRNRGGWLKLCSSLDVIGDCEMAMDAYCSKSMPSDPGVLYLATYGVLQALVVQQDAVRHLCECVAATYNWRDHAILQEIREIRNASIGHPTFNERNPEKRPYHFIVHVSLAPGGFDLQSHSDVDSHHRQVNCYQLIDGQRQSFLKVLGAAEEELKSKDADHLRQFSGDSLAARLSGADDYMEKVFEAIERTELRELALGVLGGIENMLSDFQKALETRGSDLNTYYGIKHTHVQTTYPIPKLKEHLSGTDLVEAEAVYIFAKHLRDQLDKLRLMAQEIDAEYQVVREGGQTSAASPPTSCH